MYQPSFWIKSIENNISNKLVCVDWYSAKFVQESDSTYTVELEINNNKFLLMIDCLEDSIQEFQVLAVQSFLNLSQKIVKLLRDVVEYLWYRI